MKKATLVNLGSVGLVADQSPVQLPPEGWTDMQNVRCVDGGIEPFLGHKKLLDTTGTPGAMTKVFIKGGWFIGYASGAGVYGVQPQAPGAGVGALTVPTDLTAEGEWDLIAPGEMVVANNNLQGPLYLYSGDEMRWMPFDTTTGCTWVDVTLSCQFIRSFQEHLFAFDITLCGERYRWECRVSSPRTGNEVPASWDVRNLETGAETILFDDTPGLLVDAIQYRDTLMVFKDDAILSVTYQGRRDPGYWRKRIITREVGLLSRHCVTNAGSWLFFVSDEDFYLFDGNSYKSIGDGKVKDEFFSAVNVQTKDLTFVRYNERFGEVWVFYTESGSACDKALVYSMQDNTWTRRQIPNALNGADVQVITDTSSLVTYGDWDTAGTTYADLSGTTYADLGIPSDVASESMVLGTADGSLVAMDATQTEDGTVMSCYARKTAIDLTEKPGWSMVLEVYPHATGDPFDIRVGSQVHQGSDPTWSDYQTFTPGTDYRLNFRVSGRLHTLEVKSEADVAWRLTGIEIDYQETGRR